MTASYSLTHLTDGDLLRQLSDLVARDRSTTAQLVAHLAEVEWRKLHLPAGYPSLLAYCEEQLGLSRDEALKRIRVSRVGRRFPVVFGALADGRLTLSTVHLLRRYLRYGGHELLEAAMNRTKAEVERLIAERFPATEPLAIVDRIAVASSSVRMALVVPGLPIAETPTAISAAAITSRTAPDQAPAEVRPCAQHRYGIHLHFEQGTYDKFQYLLELLSHAIPSGNPVDVMDRAFDLAIAEVEKRKFGVTSRSSSSKNGKPKGRYIPLPVRRNVLARDGHQCTFVSASGKRCSGRKFLEFHHDEQEFARGGEATEPNLCLRCRAHNQYAAEQTYGAGFMEEKRDAAREKAGWRRARRAAQAPSPTAEKPSPPRPGADADTEQDIIEGLRQLGYRGDQARRAAAYARGDSSGTLEQRFKRALSYFRPRTVAPNASS